MANKKKGDPTRSLTPKQQAFVEHYTRNRNGSEAVRHAYPAAKKWANTRVATEAAKLLAHPNIAPIVAERTAKAAEIAEKEFQIDIRSVLQRLAAHAFAEPGDYFTWGKKKITRTAKDGNSYEVETDYVDITPSDKLTAVQKRAIVSVEMTTNKYGDTFQVLKLADPVKALVKLGEHLQLFNGKVDVNVTHAGTVSHQPVAPDAVKKAEDPKDAAKLFDLFRKQQQLPAQGFGKAN